MKCNKCEQEMINQGGCWICMHCGYTHCDL